jgi:hypothetical protein
MGAVWEMCKNGEELEAAPNTRRRAAPGRLGGEAGERMRSPPSLTWEPPDLNKEMPGFRGLRDC